jgi:cytochrome P450
LSATGFRPPAPQPQPRPLTPLSLIKVLRDNPLEVWAKVHFCEPVVLGGFPFARVALVNDPAAIRHVLVENSSHYRKSAIERRILSPRLRNGLVAVDGNQWEKQRRTLGQLFTRKNVPQFAPAMQSAAAELLERWQQDREGTVIELKSEMASFALDCLVRSIFSNGLGRDFSKMRDALRAFFANSGRIDPCDIIGLPDFVPRFTRLRAHALLRPFDEALSSAIAARRCGIDAKHSDMLSIMLTAQDPRTGECLNEAEVRANVFLAFVAGQETTATALTWAIYLLSQSLEWMSRVATEARRELGRSPEHLLYHLIETRAVIEEAMRLYPPILGITRTAIARDELAGNRIERGTMVVISPYVLHRHRLLWGNPDVFDPARFLNGRGKKIERFAYLPFGIGPRMCIGAAFAMQEATLALAIIASNFSFELAPGQTVWPLQRFTVRPRDPLLMRIQRRKA